MTSNQQRAVEVLNRHWSVAQKPDPTIIRTVEELEALDPDTLVAIPRGYGDCGKPRLAGWVRTFYPLGESSPVFPAVVIATGDQVRAARQALEEA